MLRQRLAQLVSEHPGALPVSPAQDQAELFTAIPANQVARPRRGLEDFCHVEQGLVADQMTVTVIDPLEVVYVHHNEDEAFTVTAGAFAGVLQLRHQSRLIEEALRPDPWH